MKLLRYQFPEFAIIDCQALSVKITRDLLLNYFLPEYSVNSFARGAFLGFIVLLYDLNANSIESL